MLVKRKELRIKDYDYSLFGFYFVTICTQKRKGLLGNIKDGEMILNNLGHAILDIWNSLPHRFPGIGIDTFVVMPNHIHGIIIVGAQFIAPEPAFKFAKILIRISLGSEIITNMLSAMRNLLIASGNISLLIHADGILIVKTPMHRIGMILTFGWILTKEGRRG